MRLWWILLLVCYVVLGLSDPQTVRAQIFRSDDPILSDRDDIPIPKPHRKKINDYFDFLENTFLRPGDKTAKRALNINTLGEVPDSSWYTNRISRRNLSREELIRGSDAGTGPAPGLWTVVSGKSQGISPGFRIRDSRGEVYFLKFDPLTNPEMSTAAEIISTKFFHALGYNVPENYLVDLVPSDLTVDPTATVENELGEKVSLRLDRIEALLRTVARGINGTIRAAASQMVGGEDLGPFKFYGKRADDPNDIFPHEHRRELRGYYIFCSWLNHDDSRSINTRDFYVAGAGGGHVKHYLIDFGSTLGSGSISAQKRRAGNEYLWEAGPTFRSMVTFGIWLRPWVTVEYPDHPSIGRFEADFFQPERWKPEYPNAAFELMDAEDAFWAVRQVMRFSEEDIRAIVRTGRLSDPAADLRTRYPEDTPAIIAGDFNTGAEEASSAIQVLAAAGFEDALLDYAGPRWTKPRSRKKVDWIFVRDLKFSGGRVHRLEISDHYPLSVRLRLESPSSADHGRTGNWRAGP